MNHLHLQLHLSVLDLFGHFKLLSSLTLENLMILQKY